MKTRKFLAIVLAVAMLASFVSIPVFAEGEGEALETLGILAGTGDGVTQEYLATTATRSQAALIHLRLFAKEDEALAFEGEETFTDAADATEFWQPILEYLKANEDFGWKGYPDGSFMPNGTVTGKEFTKVLLVALGYEEGVDFTWETITEDAEAAGLVALLDKAGDELIIEDIAVALVEALGTNTVADETLVNQLVNDGVIDAADAEAAGFVIEDPALAIVSAGATAIDEITVVTNLDVPDDADIILKRGIIEIAVNKDVDGNIIILEGLYKFFPGTYTVTVDDLAASFVIEAQTATDLVIQADTIYDSGVQDLKVKLADQYGDAMSLAGANISVFNQTTGYVFAVNPPEETVKIEIKPLTSTPPKMNAEAGDVIYAFIYDPASGLTATKEILVMEAPYIAWLEIGDVTIGKDGDTTPPRIYTGKTGHILDVTAFDQYDNEYKLTNDDVTSSNILVLSSNSGVISAGAITVEKGNLKFNAGTTGSSVITLIIPGQGFIASSQPITVYAEATLTSVEISGPAEAVYAKETIKFPVVGYDQYGEVVDVAGDSDVTFTTTVDLGQTITLSKNEVSFKADTAGTTTVYYFANGIFQDTFTVTVNPAAYPFQITGTDLPGALETGVSETITGSSLIVIDQYGRTYGKDDLKGKSPFDATYGFVVTATTDEKSVKQLTGLELSTAGLEAGTDKFKVVLTKDEEVQDESAHVFAIRNVAASEIDGFEMKEISTMYTGSAFTKNRNATDYEKTITITGTVDGLEVKLLDYNVDGVPDTIDVITSSNAAVEIGDNKLKLTTTASDTTATIKAWRNGAVVASTEVNLEKTAPAVAKISVVVEEETFTDYATNFKYVDQYGIVLDAQDLIDNGKVIGDSWTDGTKTMYWVITSDGKVVSEVITF